MQKVLRLDTDHLSLACSSEGLHLSARDWPGFHLGPLKAAIVADGVEHTSSSCEADLTGEGNDPALRVVHRFAGGQMQLIQCFWQGAAGELHMASSLHNCSGRPLVLNHVTLLATSFAPDDMPWGDGSTAALAYLDSGYEGSVRPLQALTADARSHPAGLVYNPLARRAFLAGYLSFARWRGTICLRCPEPGSVQGWQVDFDGGDTLLEPGETSLETLVLAAGDDPWALLGHYGDLVQQAHGIEVGPPPVTWCSWYPYRLGVTEGRVLANAEVAAKRLLPLGLDTMLVDLGWQTGYLPSSFQENAQFPHGLRWLAERLESLGLQLGAWTAPFSISEYDPLCREHPEWLLRDSRGALVDLGPWFWQPHGAVYVLDLTHPGAQAWLRERYTSLAARGVRYHKTDFTSMVLSPRARRRHDPQVVAGGGQEAARMGVGIIRESAESQGQRARMLNCGLETAGLGCYDLLYACDDTGNTGYQSWDLLQRVYTSVACHLYKNRRWAIIQPSCLCVGLPGTLDEARLRATATFLSGGQVDISDELTSLPEERWQVLLATLPPTGQSARVIDLFDPLLEESLSYQGLATGDQVAPVAASNLPRACAWHLPLASDWDRWHLLALFSYQPPGSAALSRYRIPLERLGLQLGEYWAYEFWACAFLGRLPQLPDPLMPAGYRHPGDAQRLASLSAEGVLDITFAGPGVKLLALRAARPHPWVVGTSFHQSCGLELSGVHWDAAKSELSGELGRPAGQRGVLVIAGADARGAEATVGGRAVEGITGAFGALIVPVVTTGEVTPWKVRFQSFSTGSTKRIADYLSGIESS